MEKKKNKGEKNYEIYLHEHSLKNMGSKTYTAWYCDAADLAKCESGHISK